MRRQRRTSGTKPNDYPLWTDTATAKLWTPHGFIGGETLCEASPENVLRFKDVLDFLRQELHYTTHSK